ncbi:MAG: hypothetical protein EZS28_029300, partial [Streblomastix strix]
TSNPRTLHFFVNGQEQPVSVFDIPSNIRFFVWLYNPGSSFTLTRFERVQSSSARGVEGSKVLKWGYEWDEGAVYDGNLVDNISQETTDEEVYEIFQTVGIVKTVFLSPRIEQSFRLGVIQMSNEESALRAMNELNGHELNGHRIQILKGNIDLLQNIFQQNSDGESNSEEESSSEDEEQMISNRLFVGNLNFSTTGQDLGHLFESVGQVKNATVIIHNGRSKGFGFVTMNNYQQAQRAIAVLNNCKLDGRNIRIQFAKDQNEQNPLQNSNFGGERRNFGQPGNQGEGMMPYNQNGRFPSRRRFRPR